MKSESSGDFLARLGVDARLWAKEFIKLTEADMNEAVAAAWFANAIMAGHDRALLSNKQPVQYADGTLWGRAGGQLEYVSQRVEFRHNPAIPGRYLPVMVVRFTDHDHAVSPSDELVDGRFYDIEFPISEE